MIWQNLQKVKDEIASVCQRIGRNPQEITLIAITKNAPVASIQEAVDCGITDLGENRVQEAEEKYRSFKGKPVKFHLVGHLQTNKIKAALEVFDLIHSVDSLHLAQAIENQAAKKNKVVEILLQVNISGEDTKFGLASGNAAGLLQEISGLKHLKVNGLMTIAPQVDDSEKTRPVFCQLRELKDKFNSLHITHYTLHDLSMGMTDDYRIAIEEGATMLRIGRAIFESQINAD